MEEKSKESFVELFINFIDQNITIGNFEIHLISVIITVLLVIGTIITLKLIKRIFTRFENKKILDSGSSHSIYKIIKYIIYSIVAFFILGSFGVNFSTIAAGVTAFAVVIALGLQQLFTDWVSGLLLLFEQKLKVGNILQLEDGRVLKVIQINLRTTEVIDRDDIHLIIPNSKLANFKVVNWSVYETRTRFNIDVRVAYGSDVELVKEVLLSCASEHRAVHGTPEPFIWFVDFGESSLDFKLHFWSKNTFRIENTKSDIRFAIDKKFRENNIKIPFPQRDVHLKKS